MVRIGVVIPFYQRKPGTLRAALTSIAGQDTASEIIVAVVDDGSPIHADTEITGIPKFQGRVVVTRQKNAGPAAARNAGLDMLARDVDYIAFLDFDDTWSPDHLSRAERALAGGAEFYFCDYRWPGASLSQFERGGFAGVISTQTSIAADLFRHSTDFVDTVLRYHIGTGTVVLNAARFGQVRFNTDFHYAHEDTLFWLDVATAATAIAFSDRCGMFLGPGVNIFSSSGWGAPQELDRLRDEVAFCNRVVRCYRVTDAQRDYLRVRSAAARADAALTILHQVARARATPTALLRYLRTDPAMPLRVLSAASRSLTQQFGHKNPVV